MIQGLATSIRRLQPFFSQIVLLVFSAVFLTASLGVTASAVAFLTRLLPLPGRPSSSGS